MDFTILSGAIYGGYGSFLPSYERSPSVLSNPKPPQKNYNTSRSPKGLTEVYAKHSSYLLFGRNEIYMTEIL